MQLSPPTCDYCGGPTLLHKQKYCDACNRDNGVTPGKIFEVVIFDHGDPGAWRVNEIGVGLMAPTFNSKGAALAYITSGSAFKDAARKAP